MFSVQLSKRSQIHLGRLIDVAYYLMILAAFYLFIRYAFWLVFPFLFSFFVAAVLQKPMIFAHQKIRLKKSFTAVALVLLFYVLVAVVIALIGVRLWNSASGFMDYLMEQARDLPRIAKGLQARILDLIRWLPDSAELRVEQWLGNFHTSLFEGVGADGEPLGAFGSVMSHVDLQWFRAPVSGIMSTAARIPSAIVAVVVTIISSFFITASYDSIAGFIKRQLGPEKSKGLSISKRIIFQSLNKLLRSYAIIMGVTFGELWLGLLLLRLIGAYEGGYIISIAAVTALVDILPVLGTAFVLVPWSIYSLIMGNIGMGAGLLILLGVITVVRQVLEPKIIASNLGLPPIAIIAGMYIGLQLFGFIGIFLVPVLLILVKLLNDEGVVHIWKPGEESGDRGQEAGAAPKARPKAKPGPNKLAKAKAGNTPPPKL